MTSKFDQILKRVRTAEHKRFTLAVASQDAGRLVRHRTITLAHARASLLAATTVPEVVAAPIIDRGLEVGQLDDSTPVVRLDTDEHRVVLETIEALHADPELYSRGCVLVRVSHSPEPSPGLNRSELATHIQRAPAANIRERATKFASFVKRKTTKKGEEWVPAHPTKWLIEGIAARGEWPGIRPLLGLSDIPVLRADGSLFQEAGYDDATCVLYEPKIWVPPIPSVVTVDDARTSAAVLLDLISEFPVATPAGKATWLAALLTVIGRHVFSGPSPFFMVNANVAGVGKSMLVRLASVIALGHEPATAGYTPDVEEMRKVITTVAVSGDPIMLLDNINVPFGDSAMDRMLTTGRWTDRLLGKNENASAPLTTVWFGTGNAVQLAADTHRRLLEVLLDSMEERPEERQGFARPRIIEWTLENRPELVRHALIVAAAYLRAGRPAQRLPAFGSYEGWSDFARNAVVWVGMEDPCLTRKAIQRRGDDTRNDLDVIIAGWRAYDPLNRGIVIARVIRALYPVRPGNSSDADSAMRAALQTLAGCTVGQLPDPRKVGNKIRGIRRRPRNGTFLDSRDEEDTRDGALWRLFTIDSAPAVRVCDSGESSPTLSQKEMQGGEGG